MRVIPPLSDAKKNQMNEMKMVLIVTGFLSCVVKSADRER